MTQLTTAPVQPAASSARTHARPADRLQGWAVVGKLGHGQFADVYLARPESAAEAAASYAIKVLRPAFQYDLKVLELFCQEARVGRRIWPGASSSSRWHARPATARTAVPR